MRCVFLEQAKKEELCCYGIFVLSSCLNVDENVLSGSFSKVKCRNAPLGLFVQFYVPQPPRLFSFHFTFAGVVPALYPAVPGGCERAGERRVHTAARGVLYRSHRHRAHAAGARCASQRVFTRRHQVSRARSERVHTGSHWFQNISVAFCRRNRHQNAEQIPSSLVWFTF